MKNTSASEESNALFEAYPPGRDLLFELQCSLAHKVGHEFFNQVVLSLNNLVNADYTFVGSLMNEGLEIKTISLASKTGILPNFNYSLNGTPCEDVRTGGSCIINSGVANAFPNDSLLTEMGIEGYVGISVKDANGIPLGIVVSLFKNAVVNPDFVQFALQFLHHRITLELERLLIDQSIRDQQERHEFALKAGYLGVYDWNIYTNQLIFNPRLFEIIGYSPSEFHPSYANWIGLVHPED